MEMVYIIGFFNSSAREAAIKDSGYSQVFIRMFTIYTIKKSMMQNEYEESQ